jgi:hypothetical protein
MTTLSGTDLARRTRTAVTGLGGRFMIAPQMAAAAEAVGVPGHMLYIRGRVAPAGALTPEAATALLAIMPAGLVRRTFERTAELTAARAAEVCTEACLQWGRDNLSGVPAEDLARLAELGEKVVDSAELSALPLIAGWRAVPRPDDAPARAALVLHLLREHRGAIHLAAVRAQGLDVPMAILAEPSAGEARLKAFGWRDADLEAIRVRVERLGDLADRWAAAERDTDSAFGLALAVLDADEGEDLVRLCDAAVAAVDG